MSDHPKRIMVTGSRNLSDQKLVEFVLDNINFYGTVREVVEGGAKGADSIASDWAQERGITTITHEAAWDKHGRAAGPIRNREMVDLYKPDIVVAFPDQYSVGTWDAVDYAQYCGIPVLVFGAMRKRE